MATCLVALGSNLGNRIAVLERALDLLANHPAITLVECSSWFHTEPIGGPQGQGGFVNAAIRLETSHSPEELLAVLRNVEADLGRERKERWSARTVDLDLLLFDDVVLKTAQLEIPHPRMAFRRFVLEPAAEIAPDMFHPVIRWTIQQLLDHLNQAVNYVALTGPPALGKTDLARKVARATTIRLIEYVAGDVRPAPNTTDARPSGSALDVELLQRRSELLATNGLGKEVGAAISDFWVDQWIAYSRIQAEKHCPADVDTVWRTVQNRVVRPKLLVLLAAPIEWLTERYPKMANEQPSAELSHRLDRLQSELRHLALHTRQCPVVELDATQPEWALTELIATVDAMK